MPMTTKARRVVAAKAAPRQSTFVESAIGLSLVCGVLFTGVAVFSIRDDYIRFALLGTSGISAVIACVSGLNRPAVKIGAFRVVAGLYMVVVACQEFVQSGPVKTVPYVIGLFLVIASTRAHSRALARAAIAPAIVVVLFALTPALQPESYAAGRQFLPMVPGRYYGFSNPDALGFLAGLTICFALAGLATKRGKLLLVLSSLLLLLSAAYTSIIALACAAVVLAFTRWAFFANTARRIARLLAWTGVAALAWLSTPAALTVFAWLFTHVSLTNRTRIWYGVLQLAQGSDFFTFGVGDRQVAVWTERIYGVGSLHAALLQLLLSKGFFTGAAFVLIAASAAQPVLLLAGSRLGLEFRLGAAVVVFWAATALTSIQPANPLVFAVVLTFGVAARRTLAEMSKADLGDRDIEPPRARPGARVRPVASFPTRVDGRP